MFTREELEDARDKVHAVFPGTAQYRWPLLAELSRDALPESSSSGFDAGIQGLTYSGGCQLPCWSLPLSSSCIYLAFAVVARGATPRTARTEDAVVPVEDVLRAHPG